jgi:tRNA wybutosine-synthesizing protein 1
LIDEPEAIVEESVRAHRRILTGYNGQEKVDKAIYREALDPRHAAISLDGEPTLYPKLNGLVDCFRRRGFTTFIVTNGSIPKALENLEEPSQMYLSLYAPNEQLFNIMCRPQVPGLWANINRSLELLQTFSCPTVLRLTMVRGLNMIDPKGYAELIKKANPVYVEPKAYMYIGSSRARLSFENMPTHQEIKAFSERLAEETGYKIINESEESRVTLLSRIEKTLTIHP